MQKTEEELKKDAYSKFDLKLESIIDAISDRLTDKFKGAELSEYGRELITPYILKLWHDDPMDAFNIALEKMNSPESTIKYFIGICKNWIANGKTDYRLTRGGK